jgi:hypothetical protein
LGHRNSGRVMDTALEAACGSLAGHARRCAEQERHADYGYSRSEREAAPSYGSPYHEHDVFGECGRTGRNQVNGDRGARAQSNPGSRPDDISSGSRKRQLGWGNPASVVRLARSLRGRGKIPASPSANLKRMDAPSIPPSEGERAPTRRSMICPDLLPFGLYRRPRSFTGSWKISGEWQVVSDKQ